MEICISFQNANRIPFLVDFHFIVMDNVPGYYVYGELRYDPQFTGDAEVFLEAIHRNYRLDPSVFTSGVIGAKSEIMPLPSELKPENEVMDATYYMEQESTWRQRYGRKYYTKYNYVNMRSEFKVSGLTGDGYGFCILQSSHEHLSSAP